ASASKTGWTLLGELLMTLRISEVAVCCSSASASFISRSARSLRLRPTRTLAFVPVERSLRLRVGLFAPLRDKGHLVGTVTGPVRSAQRINPNRTARCTPAASFDHLVAARQHRERPGARRAATQPPPTAHPPH